MSLLMDALRKAEEARKKAEEARKKAERDAKPDADPLTAETGHSAASTTVETEESPVVPTPEVDGEIESATITDPTPSTPNLEPPPEIAIVEPESTSGLELELSPKDSHLADENLERKLDSLDNERNAPPDTDERKPTTDGLSAQADFVPVDAVQGADETIGEAVAMELGSPQSPELALEKLSPQAEDEITASASARDRVSAQAVFAAKRPMQKTRRNLQIAGFGAVALLIIGFGPYFYNSLSSPSGIGVSIPQVVDAQGAESDNIATPVAQLQAPVDDIAPSRLDAADLDLEPATRLASQEPASDSAIEISRVSGVDEPEVEPAQLDGLVGNNDRLTAAPVAENQLTDQVALESSSLGSEPLTQATVPTELTAVAARMETTNSIIFTRRESDASIDPLVSEAYLAYQQGNFRDAERLYRQVLRNSPRHRDALLGLAAIASQNNEFAVAMDLYSRLLTRDPSDALARAGLLELMPSGSVAEQENELRRLVASHPDMAPLAYALGNFYASAQRWNEAQQTYFQALQLAKTDALEVGPVNPDYAFNLAISLEYLGQPEPAQSYYRQALDFARNHPAGFDLDVVNARLEDINRKLSK